MIPTVTCDVADGNRVLLDFVDRFIILTANHFFVDGQLLQPQASKARLLQRR
jgi:hypothetical protein